MTQYTAGERAAARHELNRSRSILWKVRELARILQSYAVVRILLARRPLPQVLAGLRAAPPRAEPPRDALVDQALAVRLGAAVVRVLSVLPTDSRCLVRSLVLVRLLVRRGIDAKLVIGISPSPSFAAHAWVETAGTPLLPTQGAVPSYERLIEL